VEAELEAGIVLSARQFSAISAARLRMRSRSAPIKAAATRPNGGESRVATPDGRLAVEDGTEPAFLGERLQLGTRIGDDARTALASRPASSQKCSRCERVSSVVPDLEDATKKRAVHVDRLLQSADRLRMRRVEDVEVAGLEGARKTSGARLDPPIPNRT
jgi:hypothetical protein